MAQRHNEYARLLGTVENGLPIANVPSLVDVAGSLESSAQWHLGEVQRHAETLRKLGDNQPNFSGEQLEGG